MESCCQWSTHTARYSQSTYSSWKAAVSGRHTPPATASRPTHLGKLLSVVDTHRPLQPVILESCCQWSTHTARYSQSTYSSWKAAVSGRHTLPATASRPIHPGKAAVSGRHTLPATASRPTHPGKLLSVVDAQQRQPSAAPRTRSDSRTERQPSAAPAREAIHEQSDNRQPPPHAKRFTNRATTVSRPRTRSDSRTERQPSAAPAREAIHEQSDNRQPPPHAKRFNEQSDNRQPPPHAKRFTNRATTVSRPRTRSDSRTERVQPHIGTD